MINFNLRPGDIAQLITSIATLIGVLRVGIKVEVLRNATNGIVERLVQTTAKASSAEGHAHGLTEGRQEGIESAAAAAVEKSRK